MAAMVEDIPTEADKKSIVTSSNMAAMFLLFFPLRNDYN
jgi:hypothetical protein